MINVVTFSSADGDSNSHKDEPPSPAQVPTSTDTLGMFAVVVSLLAPV